MKTLLHILVICSFLPAWSQDQDLSQLNPLSARAFLVQEEIRPGELSDLQLELDLQDGFFAYEERFLLKVLAPKDIRVGELFIDPIVEFDDKISKKKKRGVHKSATLKTQLDIPARLSSDIQQMDMELTYIACTEKFCLTPRTIALSTQVVVKTLEKTNADKISSSAYIQQQIDDNLAYALILIFIFGLLTSLTPCVYPLIPITLAVLGANKQKTKFSSFLVSLSYVAGIGLTYALLGVVAAQTGQLFGSLISHPVVIVAMSTIFFLMGLSLMGAFELQAPQFIRNRMNQNMGPNKGHMGAFVSGLLAGVIASPCVGPVLVGILAYIAKTQNSGLGFLLLYTFAMGFGVLFIVLGTFTHLVDKLPRSGAWMNFIKTLLALVMFALAVYYSYPLAKKYLPQSPTQSNKQKGLSWTEFSDEKVQKAKVEGRPVIIDFYADWCVACVEMDQFTFSKKIVQDKAKDFTMLKVDATLPSPQINELQQRYQVYGLPTMIFIDKNGDVREDLTLTGFEEAEEFILRMDATLQEPQNSKK
jgi:thioredoxin:protein disulfide reductase